jgi:HTH-type transcriptional regulator / antitoxin HigA
MTKIEMQPFQPIWASAPGETIADILEEQNLSRDTFAARIGFKTTEIKNLLEGRLKLTDEIAQRLEVALGIPATFWIKRESQYTEDVSRLQRAPDACEKKWLSDLPLKDMAKLGWIDDAVNPLAACLHFFGVSGPTMWHEKYKDIFRMAAFKTSAAFESETGSVSAWLRQGEIESDAINCKTWNPDAFKKALPKIRLLTRQYDPSLFIPILREICAESGVAVVVLRAPSGCRASGATYFLSQEKALLLLSFRYLSDDHFWFSFFHEVGHLLLHKKTLFLEGTEKTSTKEECEANDFAATTLIPKTFEPEMLKLPLNGIAVIRFARAVGVSPGIVVGQLQHRGVFTQRQLNNLKRRFLWSD